MSDELSARARGIADSRTLLSELTLRLLLSRGWKKIPNPFFRLNVCSQKKHNSLLIQDRTLLIVFTLREVGLKMSLESSPKCLGSNIVSEENSI